MNTTRKPGSSRSFIPHLAALALVLGVEGCTHAPWFAVTAMPREPVTISRVYIYSFLDLRAGTLGPRMVNEIARQLTRGLESRGITTEHHSFASDPLFANFAHVDSTVLVPVDEVIRGNQEQERRLSPDHRLIVVPSQTIDVGARRSYNIRWTLQNTRTQRVVWSATSHSRHRPSLDVTRPARLIVDGLFAQMATAGLLGQPASASHGQAWAPSGEHQSLGGASR